MWRVGSLDTIGIDTIHLILWNSPAQFTCRTIYLHINYSIVVFHAHSLPRAAIFSAQDHLRVKKIHLHVRQSCYRSYQFFHQSREGDSDSGTEYKNMQIPSTLALPSIFHSVCVQNFTLVWHCGFRSFHDCYCWSFRRKIRKLIARQLDNGFQLNPRGVPCSAPCADMKDPHEGTCR